MKHAHICSFQAGPDVKQTTKYEEFREAILKAGKFSVFEATANSRSAAMFYSLCRDPLIETDHETLGYPWTVVRKRA